MQNNTSLSGGAGICLYVCVCQAFLRATGEPRRPRTPLTPQLPYPCLLLLVGNPFPVHTARPKNVDANTWRKRANTKRADPDSHTTAPVVKSTTWELLRGLHKCQRDFCISVTLLPLLVPGESWKSDIASLSLSRKKWTVAGS